MPIWPFKKRRTKTDIYQPVTEKAQGDQQQPNRAATYPPSGPTQPIAIPSRSSRGNQGPVSASAPPGSSDRAQQAPGKENVPPAPRRGSREDITALPVSQKLSSSPHLRPATVDRPAIPYNFRPYSSSHTSIQQEPQEMIGQRPNKLRSRRSAYDSTPQSRHTSNRKRQDDRLREEEIRAMGAHSPIPKRPGEGTLRRDSKKLRNGLKNSYVSLPAEDDVDSNLTSLMEQRGWEVGSLDIFNPRPAVRLSGTPQFVTPSSAAAPSPLAEMVKKNKEKMPASRDRTHLREAIGNRADDLDASDIRALMERDAKRREKRKKEQQEKLEKKLRNRNGRNRGDSDKSRRRRDAEAARRAEEAAAESSRVRDIRTPPTDVHPAFREQAGQASAAAVGLGIGEHQEQSERPLADEKVEDAAEQIENPFTDAAAPERPPTPPIEEVPGAFPAVETPLETPWVEEAREMQMTQTATPPMSPVSTTRVPSDLSQAVQSRSDDAPLPPPPVLEQRRSSDPKPERRAGPWATFFRRGGTNLRKPGDTQSPPSEASFSNTSRESMRNQPLPAHLVDTSVQRPRRKSGTPVRTQSRFRENLDDVPASPPDSTLPSPAVMDAATAAARRRGRLSGGPGGATLAEIEAQHGGRTDTPVSPSIRSNRMASMASIDSEGSWLGSGKRHSTQPGLNRSIGSLNQRFTSSYEELGVDRDNEHFQRTLSPTTRTRLGASELADDIPDEESDEDGNAPLETPGEPVAMHEGVRRQPTLVHRDPRFRSREGLLTDFSQGETPEPTSAEPTSAMSGRGSLMGFGPDEPEPQIQRASSVDYKNHARQISGGSARLLDVGSPKAATFPEEPMPTSPPTGR